MTNQASEDELRRYHLSGCAKYETLRGIYPNDRRLTGNPCSCGIEALIRIEKLKLLAEVREQTTIFKIKAHDKKGQPHLYEAGRGVPTDVLTKLGAEL